MAENPTRSVSVSLTDYIRRRETALGRHMAGGIPDYAFGVDLRMRQKIRAMPGVYQLMRVYTSEYVPMFRQHLLAQSLKVGPAQLPHIYRAVCECAGVLGIGVPMVFVENAPAVINAYTYATEEESNIVVLTSALVERLDEAELKAVIGHECGHIHNNHSIYTSLLRALADASFTSIPLLRQMYKLLILPLTLSLNAWSRAAEVTSDRAALLCTGDLAACHRVETKLLSGGMMTGAALDAAQIMRQYDQYRDKATRLEEMFATHPTAARRMIAQELFARSEVYYGWYPDRREAGVNALSAAQLDIECTRIVSVSESGGKRA